MTGRRGPCPRPPTTSTTCSAGGSRPSGPRRPIHRSGLSYAQCEPPRVRAFRRPSWSTCTRPRRLGTCIRSVCPRRARGRPRCCPRARGAGARAGKPRGDARESRGGFAPRAVRRSRSQTPQKVIDDGPIWASAANTIMFSAKAPAHHQRLRSRRPSSSGIGAGGTGRSGRSSGHPRQGSFSTSALRRSGFNRGRAGSRGRSARRGPPAGNARHPRSSPARSPSGSSR